MNDQVEYWRSSSGNVWADEAHMLDVTLKPVTELLIETADLSPGHRVLDVGCGAGTSTRAAARRLGENGSVLGVDLSPYLLEAARKGAPQQASFQVANAESDALGQADFDRIISQLGVMFFNDSVKAFENMRICAKSKARLTFVAWGAGRDNPCFVLPHTAAAAELGDAPSDPDGPGPTRFRDPIRTANLLEAAGWVDVHVAPVDLYLTPDEGLADVAAFSTRVGPAARLLRLKEGDAAAQDRVRRRIEQAFQPFVTQQGLRIPARINLATAVAP